MQFHGVAIALTGSDPRAATITVTTTVADDAQREQVAEVPEHTFKIPALDLHDKTQVQEAFCRIAETIGAVTDKQQKGFEDAGIPPRPVALVVGIDGRKEYDVPALQALLAEDPDQDRQSNPRLKFAYATLGKALPYCWLRWGSFGFYETNLTSKAAEEIALLESGGNKANNFLLQAKNRLDAGDPTIVPIMVRVIPRAACNTAQQLHAQGVDTKHQPFFAEKTLWPDYWKRPDLQKQYPIGGALYTWHPDIYATHVSALKMAFGVVGNFVYQPSTAKPSPFYTDVTKAMIWDQMDILNGKFTETEVQYNDNPQGRARLSAIFTGFGAAIKNPMRPTPIPIITHPIPATDRAADAPEAIQSRRQ